MRTGWSVTTQLLSLAVQWHNEQQHWQYFSVGVVVSMVSSFVSIVSTCLLLRFDVYGWMHIGLGFRVTRNNPVCLPSFVWMWMFLLLVLSQRNNPLFGVFLEWFFSVL